MTAVQAQCTSDLRPLRSEDLMEVTSEMDQHFEFGEEIDVDFDLNGEKQAGGEDEYMVEDGESLPEHDMIQTKDMSMMNDNEMADDGYGEGLIAERSSVHDEELQDAEYAVPEYGEDDLVGTMLEDETGQHSDLYDEEEQIEDEGFDGRNEHKQLIDDAEKLNVGFESFESVDNSVNDPGRNASPTNDEEEIQSDVRSNDSHQKTSTFLNHARIDDTDKAVAVTSIADSDGPTPILPGVSHKDDEIDPQTSIKELHVISATPYHSTHEALYSEIQSDIENSEVTDSAATDHVIKQNSDALPHTPEVQLEQTTDEPSSIKSGIRSPSSTDKGEETNPLKSVGLHPVIVIYQDDEISLFPPINHENEQSSTYFLHEEQIAYDTITKVLGACRSVLAECIAEHEELVIDIDDLGLQISEFAPESSTITLKNLIDIYVQLQHYDGQEFPQALYIRLTTRPRFSYRLETLVNAVAEGKGLSCVQPLYDDEDLSGLENEAEKKSQAEKDLDAANVVPINQQGTPQAQTAKDNHKQQTHRTSSESNAPRTDSLGHFETPGHFLESGLRPDVKKEGIAQVTHFSETGTGKEETNDINSVGDYQTENLEETLSSPVLPLASDSEQRGASTVEHEDFIDYDDEEDQTDQISSGSSTLQGNSLNLNSHDPHASTEKNLNPNDALEESENTELVATTSLEETSNDTRENIRSSQKNVSKPLAKHNSPETDQVPSVIPTPSLHNPSNEFDQEEHPGSQKGSIEEGSEEISSLADTTLPKDEPATFYTGSSSRPQSGDDGDDNISQSIPLNIDNTKDKGYHGDEQNGNTSIDISRQQQKEVVSIGHGPVDTEQTKIVPHDGQNDPSNSVHYLGAGNLGRPTRNVHEIQEDDDEITFDDDDDDDDNLGSEIPRKPFGTEKSPSSITTSSKRARSPQEDGESFEFELQGGLGFNYKVVRLSIDEE